MELSLPASPVHLAGLRQATRACLRGVASETAEDVVLALKRGSHQRHPVRVRRGEPVQVVVHVNDDVIQASVLDHGPDLPPSPQPMPTPTRWPLAVAGYGCCAGWWTRCGSTASRPARA